MPLPTVLLRSAPPRARLLPKLLLALLPALLLPLVAGPATLRAEEPAPETEVSEASAEQLPALLEALEAAGKAKKAPDALKALEALAGLKHVQLEKGLLKLLKHAEPAVALRAAELLELRAYPAWKGLWAASWGQAANDKRPAVRAKVLRAFARIGLVLDKKQAEEVEKHWRWTLGNPARSNAPQLVDIAFYVEQAKDKRFARWLAEHIDEPIATNPNDPNT
ncbi:MAG: hypothetical protein ACKOSS_12485, partial [Planctomycetia bacterium]